MKNNIPTISIITPTLNNEKQIGYFLTSLKRQTYPKNKMEVIIVDGGSIDKTIKIAKKFNTKIINNPKILAEPGIYLGMQKAKGDLMMILATDNIFEDKHAIKKIANVFISNKDIYAAFPKHESYKKSNLFTKYHNTFTDPFNHFIYGYAANARTFKRIYKTIIQNSIYDIYDYSSTETKPMIALAQGFTIRTVYKKKRKDKFDDCKPVIDIINDKKYIAYIHSVPVYHDTIRGLSHFMRKQRWATQNALDRKKYGIHHRMKLLSSKQKWRIKIWPLYALSIVFPTIVAIHGLLKDKKAIWLFHPINCFLSATASIYQIIIYTINSKIIKRKKIIFRQ